MFDQIVLFMVFLMLCFAGLAAMVYFVLRSLDELSREIKGERSQLVGLLQSMESSLDILVKVAQLSVQQQKAGPGAAEVRPQAASQVAAQTAASAKTLAAQNLERKYSSAGLDVGLGAGLDAGLHLGAELKSAQAAASGAGLSINSSGSEADSLGGGKLSRLSLDNPAAPAKRQKNAGLSLADEN